jgi:SEC-C motif-containing protein
VLSRSRVSGGEGYPSETRVGRGDRVVHGDKELIEKLGRNDLCPCGSGRRFQDLLPALRPLRRQRTQALCAGLNRRLGPDSRFARPGDGVGKATVLSLLKFRVQLGSPILRHV